MTYVPQPEEIVELVPWQGPARSISGGTQLFDSKHDRQFCRLHIVHAVDIQQGLVSLYRRGWVVTLTWPLAGVRQVKNPPPREHFPNGVYEPPQ